MEELEEINNAFESAEKINIYKDGIKTTYSCGSNEYSKIIKSYYSMVDGSHEMPALGVSLNNETVKELSRGLWAEFEFDKVTECNGMPFKKLLIKVEKDNYGFNIIRYNSKQGYDGRCFYIDRGGNSMATFYAVLINL